MARLRMDFAGGLLAQDLQPSDTIAVSPSFGPIPVVNAPDYFPITLDPGGNPEVAYIVTHALGSASVTLQRAAEQGASNPAVLHAAGLSWVQAPTAKDYDGRLLVATSTTLPSAPDDGTTVLAADNNEVYSYLAATGWFQVGGVPVGVIMAYAVGLAANTDLTAPAGYLFCNGQSVTEAAFPTLYALLHNSGNPFGVDGSLNPKVPDLRNRRLVGAGGSDYAAGATGGNDTYVLGLDDMPPHTHPITDPGHNHAVVDSHHYHSGIHVTGISGGGNAGWIAFADPASSEGTTATGIATKATYSMPSAVVTGSSASSVSISNHETGIVATSGVSGYGSQTAVDMRAPYVAAPFIIKAA